MLKHNLEVDSVRLSFGERQLLTDVYLKCQTGEILGLLGRNGTGKSTLLQIIFGTQSTDNKFIRIDGQVYSIPFTARGLIAYLPQDSFLPGELKVLNLINLFLPGKESREKVMHHKQVQPHLKTRASALSGGERKYLEILLLLHLKSHFILLDEPFSGISPLYIDEISELLHSFRAVKGIIMTDHNYRSIIKVSDRVMLLHDGVCRHLKSPEELENFGYLPVGKL